jgi:DNA-directed RNA polymerase specialized sigma24 family protein
VANDLIARLARPDATDAKVLRLFRQGVSQKDLAARFQCSARKINYQIHRALAAAEADLKQ